MTNPIEYQRIFCRKKEQKSIYIMSRFLEYYKLYLAVSVIETLECTIDSIETKGKIILH